MRDIVAEFRKTNGKRLVLWSLTVIEEKGIQTYDVDWSRTYGYVFHMSGGGPGPVKLSGIYWASPGIEVKELPCELVSSSDKPPWKSKETKRIRTLNRTRRLRAIPKGFRVESGKDLLDWLWHNAIEGEVTWCSTCRDWLPDSSLCQHVWWCDKACGYSTPDERCECKGLMECQSA